MSASCSAMSSSVSGPNWRDADHAVGVDEERLRRTGDAEVDGQAPVRVDDVRVARVAVAGEERRARRPGRPGRARRRSSAPRRAARAPPASTGCSSTHAGMHHDAQKFTRYGRPARSSELSVSPVEGGERPGRRRPAEERRRDLARVAAEALEEQPGDREHQQRDEEPAQRPHRSGALHRGAGAALASARPRSPGGPGAPARWRRPRRCRRSRRRSRSRPPAG